MISKIITQERASERHTNLLNFRRLNFIRMRTSCRKENFHDAGYLLAMLQLATGGARRCSLLVPGNRLSHSHLHLPFGEEQRANAQSHCSAQLRSAAISSEQQRIVPRSSFAVSFAILKMFSFAHGSSRLRDPSSRAETKE